MIEFNLYNMLILQKDLDRFWAKVNKTNTCWLWIAASSNFGHGRFRFEGKLYSSHIISYQLHKNDYDKTKLVCHTCDNPSCVNPHHLFLGSNSDNMRDCVAKGRHRINAEYLKGEECYQSKLTKADVQEIKRRLGFGERVCNINRDYPHVSRRTIEGIKSGKNWKHVTLD